MMKRGVILIIGAVLLVAITVIAIIVSRSNQTTVTEQVIKIWSPYDESKAWDKLTANYLKDNSNVKIDFQYIQASDAKDYEAKVVNAIAAGTGPDIWLIRNDWLYKHQTKLTPSTGYVEWSTRKGTTEKQALLEQFGEMLLAQNSIGDDLYSRPYSVDSLALYINEDVVSAVRTEYDDQNNAAAVDALKDNPKTWDDVVKWVSLITKKSGSTVTRSGIALGTADNTYAATDVLQAMLVQYRGNFFSDDLKTVAFNLARIENNQSVFPAQQALSLYSSFAKTDSANYTWNSSMGDPVTAFATGKTAMLIGYSSTYNEIRRVNKALESVSVVSLPQVKDLDLGGDRIDYGAYYTPVVVKTSTNPKLAWQLLKGIDDEAIDEYSKISLRPIVTQQKLDETNKWLSTDYGKTDLFAQQLLWSAKLYKPEWQTIDEALQTAISQVVTQNQSVVTAIDTATDRLKKLIP